MRFDCVSDPCPGIGASRHRLEEFRHLAAIGFLEPCLPRTPAVTTDGPGVTLDGSNWGSFTPPNCHMIVATHEFGAYVITKWRQPSDGDGRKCPAGQPQGRDDRVRIESRIEDVPIPIAAIDVDRQDFLAR